jgi:hypothetical protein
MLLALVAALSISGDPLGTASGPVLQAATPASSGAAVTPVKAKTAKAAESDTICWTEEPVGSHIPHHYCAPRAYWEARQRADQNAISPFYRTSTAAGSAGGLSASGAGGGGPSGH